MDPATTPYNYIVKLPQLKRVIFRGLIKDSALAYHESGATFVNK